MTRPNNLVYPILLLALSLSIPRAAAQEACQDLFMATDENAELEYIVYDKRGKQTARMTNKVILTEETRKGVVYHIESTLIGENTPLDPQIQTYTLRCRKDTLFLSMKCMLAPGTLESYRNMQMEISGDELPFPGKLQEDAQLPNASMQVNISSGGMRVVHIKATTTERKVSKKEKITTAAGEFDCFKITETTEVKVGFITTKTKTESWYASGVGLVKQESYDKKGRLDSRRELFKLLN